LSGRFRPGGASSGLSVGAGQYDLAMEIWIPALGAALVVAAVAALVQRSRNVVSGAAQRVWGAVSPRQQNARALAIERIAAELADLRCRDDGNPDDEFRSDWVRWFQGDPDADIDYARKAQRDLDRLHGVAPPGLAEQMVRDGWPRKRVRR
jgi:hypothetical protein